MPNLSNDLTHIQKFKRDNPPPTNEEDFLRYEQELLRELDNWHTSITDLAAAHIRQMRVKLCQT